jgi:methionyl-tRNA formyltransferase
VRLAVLSSTTFGHRCIREGVLGVPGVELVGVITTPKRIKVPYAAEPITLSTHATFDDIARDSGCEVASVDAPAVEDYLGPLERWRADLVIALGWYYLVPKRVRTWPARGCLGIHASLLPRNRGGAPIPWAIIEGERETGVTLFHLDKGVDNGDIVGQVRIPIEDRDTAATVYDKATVASADVLRQMLPRLADGTAPRLQQDESQASVYPQRKPEDGEIDWSWSPKRIRDFIRAQTRPYPGAFTIIGGKKVTIWDADVTEVEPSSR